MANIDTLPRLESRHFGKKYQVIPGTKNTKGFVEKKTGNTIVGLKISEDPTASYCWLLSILDSMLLHVHKVSTSKTPALAPSQVFVKVPSS